MAEEKSPIPTDKVLMRPHQVAMVERDVEKLAGDLSNPGIQMKGRVRKQLSRMKEQLESQRPPVVQGAEKDRVAKRVRSLIEEVRTGMLTGEEMRKAPTGAPDYLLKWEKANKKKVNELKNGLLMLAVSGGDYSGTETDIANIEKFRPVGNQDRGYRSDSIIHGHLAMSPLAKHNWPLGEPTVDTALAQAQRVARQTSLDDEFAPISTPQTGDKPAPVKVKAKRSDAAIAKLREVAAKARAAKAAKKALETHTNAPSSTNPPEPDATPMSGVSA